MSTTSRTSKKLHFSNLNVPMMTAFLTNSDVGLVNGQVIEFTKQEVRTRGYPMARNFLRATTLQASNLLTYKDFPENVEEIHMPLPGFGKLRKYMTTLAGGGTQMDGYLEYQLVTLIDPQGYDAPREIHVVTKIVLEYKGGKTTLGAQEHMLSDFSFTNERWLSVFARTENFTARFDISGNMAIRLRGLFSLSSKEEAAKKGAKLAKEDNPQFRMTVDSESKSIVFASVDGERWSIPHEGNLTFAEGVINTKFGIGVKFLNDLKGELNTVFLVKMKDEGNGVYCLIAYETKEAVIMHGIENLG